MVAKGPCRRPQWRCASRRPLSEISERWAFLALILVFCATHVFDQPSERDRASPHMNDQAFQRAFKRAVVTSRCREVCYNAYPAPFVRDWLAPQWLRHSNRAGVARPFRRLHDDDLHACAESRRCRSALTSWCAATSLAKGWAAQVNPGGFTTADRASSMRFINDVNCSSKSSVLLVAPMREA